MNSTNTKLAGLRGFLAELRPAPDEVWGVVSPMVHNAGWLYSYLPALLIPSRCRIATTRLRMAAMT